MKQNLNHDFLIKVAVRLWDHGDALDKLTLLATINQQIQHLYGLTAGNLGWEIISLDDTIFTISCPGHAMEQLLATLPTISLTAITNRRITLSVIETKESL